MCSLAGGNRVTNGDLAISEDVGVEPAAVDEFLDDPCPCHLLQMLARLAQFDAETLDIPDSKAPADQLVEPHTPHDHLTARLSAGQADVFQCFGLDQRQRLAGFCAPPAEVAVAASPLPASALTDWTGIRASLGPVLIASTFTSPSWRSAPPRPTRY